MSLSFLYYSLCLLVSALVTYAYVPASPTNNTDFAITHGLNVTDVSKLNMAWYPNGADSQNVSYQLAGSGSQGISQGALVHFSEMSVNNDTPPTTAPWIALVSCDHNATNASQEIDIFTLARDKGAVAAVLYSLNHSACVINEEYADPTTFDQVFDIFSTQSYTSSNLIEYQFGQSGAINRTLYSSYDSKRLNDSESVIRDTLASGKMIAPGYLIATLRAYNATGEGGITSPAGSTDDGGNGGGHHSSSTNLAMIVLYTITGCVSALFVVVIISGAVRAMRHPERYGPRAIHREFDGGQSFMPSRARGLTRAIVDTFPVFKFGSSTDQQAERADILKDTESGTKDNHKRGVSVDTAAVEMTDWVAIDASLQKEASENVTSESTSLNPERSEVPITAGHVDESSEAGPSIARIRSNTHNAEGSDSASSPMTAEGEEALQSKIGVSTCPICIASFEEGEDLRQLPCQGKHVFHQQCVDPWLLELSSSCPLCRHDFLALETLLSSEPSEESQWQPQLNAASPRQSSGSRFSRYLRFARRRRREQELDLEQAEPPLPREPILAHVGTL